MKKLLIETLEKLGFKSGATLFLQGTLGAEQEYPESFVTFWIYSTADNQHYDNETNSVDWYVTVYFYSSSAILVNTKPDEIRAALKAVGFVPQGKGNDMPSDEPTHTGWAQEFIYKEILK